MRYVPGGRPKGLPYSPPEGFLRTVGEGLEVNRPKAERSHPGVCPSRPHLVLPPSVGRDDSARRLTGFRPAGRVTFCMDRKSPKNHQGDAQDGRSAPIFASPWTPFTGDTPEKFSKISGAQSQECLPAFPSGPTGALGGRKFAAGAVQELRLGLPSQCSRCESWREAQGPPLRKPGNFS